MTNDQIIVLQTIDDLTEQGRSANELKICGACGDIDNRTIHKTLRGLYRDGVLDYDDNGDYFRR